VLVGNLCVQYLKATGRARIAVQGGTYAGFLYSVHPAHFLAVVWVATANSTLSIIFATLALTALVAGLVKAPAWRFWLALMPVVFLLALLCRESAVVIPMLGVILFFLIKPETLSRELALSTLVSMVILVLWLIIRQSVSSDINEQYAPRMGLNILRNAAGLFVFTLGVPREALRFTMEFGSLPGLLWGAACAVLHSALLYLLVLGGRGTVSRFASVLLLVFFLAGCSVYLLLGWNCYAYYLSLSLIAYALYSAQVLAISRHRAAIVCIAVLGSILSTYANYQLPYPSIIGRAKAADIQIRKIEDLLAGRLNEVRRSGLDVVVGNPHRFAAIGRAGISFKLGISKDKIHVFNGSTVKGQRRLTLVLPENGEAFLIAP
jgi:hypothetical protein